MAYRIASNQRALLNHHPEMAALTILVNHNPCARVDSSPNRPNQGQIVANQGLRGSILP